MVKILIVGGTGFVGQACLTKLLPYNISVVGRQARDTLIGLPNVDYYQLNLYNDKEVEDFLKKSNYTHLLYLAWPLTPPHNDPEQINFSVASIKFFNKFAQFNPYSRIVCIGSIYETGINSGKIYNDFKNTEPKNLYGVCKKFVYDSMQILLSNHLKNISFCWIRLSNVYGCGDHAHKVMPTIIANALQNKITPLNNPNVCIDFVHIKDAANGICLALFSDYNGVINIGSGKVYVLQELQKFIECYIPKEHNNSLACTINSQLISEFGPVLDLTIAAKILKYVPYISIEAGIIEYVDFLRYKDKVDEKS